MRAAGIYWDPQAGDDAGDGTEEKPVKTFARVRALFKRPGTVYLRSNMAALDGPITIPRGMSIVGKPKPASSLPTLRTTGNDPGERSMADEDGDRLYDCLDDDGAGREP